MNDCQASHPIILKGITNRNLQNIDITFNSGEFIIFTGVSGSGKSSLAFNTIYTEGQRHYLETVSSFLRFRLKGISQGEVESIEGLSPTIAVEQRSFHPNPRSTAGTLSGIYDLLRHLYALAALPYCPLSGKPIIIHSREYIMQTALSFPEKTRIKILAPYEYSLESLEETLSFLVNQGFVFARVSGKYLRISELPSITFKSETKLEIQIDDIILEPRHIPRIKSSILQGLRIGKGNLIMITNDEEQFFSQRFYSLDSGDYYHALEATDFSFNNNSGKCPKCSGLGTILQFSEQLVMDPNKSISEDACLIGGKYKTIFYNNIYKALSKRYNFSLTTPWKDLSSSIKNIFLYGTGEIPLKLDFLNPNTGYKKTEYFYWQGVLNEAIGKYEKSQSIRYKQNLESFLEQITCPLCKGSRLRSYPSSARFHQKTLPELCNLPFVQLLDFFKAIDFKSPLNIIAKEISHHVIKRLTLLCDLGLGYLNCNRNSETLSGGESRRIALSAQIGSGANGITYIFDEPSIGLHPEDNRGLINAIISLKQKGNTIIIVEHDEEIILAADRIVDIGPGAGIQGGKIMFNGLISEFLQTSQSITAKFLRSEETIPIPKQRKKSQTHIVLKGAVTHNLKNLTLRIPLKSLTVITGISGSGKSSLINDTLIPAVKNALSKHSSIQTNYESLDLPEEIHRIVNIDQKPLSKNSRSTPATYIKVFDDIRSLYASLPASRQHGYSESHFSFNVKEGACSVCNGLGKNKIDSALDNLWISCSSCSGKRFSTPILQVLFRNKSIGDILSMTVSEAFDFFEQPSIRNKLGYIQDIGLGHLELGRPLTTLSGGESQRLKIASELLIPHLKHTLYVLDEPSIGLHMHDLKAFMKIIDTLTIDHTVLIIEHNMHIAKTADLIVDMGPGGGPYGGQILNIGTPELIAKCHSATGRALKKILIDKPIYNHPKLKTILPVPDNIIVTNASKNNLKHIDVIIPQKKITVISGPCGSGKNSLLTGTLYATGQRLYADSLPIYLRQFFYMESDPCVQEINNLSSVVSVERHFANHNPRSTIATTTEIHGYLQKMFSLFGIAHCPVTQEELINVTESSIMDFLVREYQETPLTIAAPVVLQDLKQYRNKGFIKCLINKTIHPLEDLPHKIKPSDEISVIIDHLKIGNKTARLIKAIQTAFMTNPEEILIITPEKCHKFRLGYVSPSKGIRYSQITPSLFSFNCEEGMCPNCLGTGFEYLPDFNRNEKITLKEILAYFFPDFSEPIIKNMLSGIPINTPLAKLDNQEKEYILNGYPLENRFPYKNVFMKWKGISKSIQLLSKCAPEPIKTELKELMQKCPCKTCHGTRLNTFSGNVRVCGKTIGELMIMSIDDLILFLDHKFSSENYTNLELKQLQVSTGQSLLKYLKIIQKLGLGYLTTNRLTETLSSGELYRLHFINKITNNLSNITYLIEDPTLGMHPQEIETIINILKDLTLKNNTVVISGNHPYLTTAADHNLYLGPGSGPEGGHLINRDVSEPLPKTSQLGTTPSLVQRNKLSIKKCKANNLKNISLSIPLNTFVCICGISGSGKSTLLFQGIQPEAEELKNSGAIDDIVAIRGNYDYISQKSDIGTYLEISPFIRQFFSALPDARAVNLNPSYFSHYTEEGMCSVCLGKGYKINNTHFQSKHPIACAECSGFGLNPLTQDVKYKGKHFGHILMSNLKEIRETFSFQTKFAKLFYLLNLFNLDHLKLGQGLSELSFGERKKIKLIKILNKNRKKRCIYLIDEVGGGLDDQDISTLITLFRELIKEGNSIICVEHHQKIIPSSDFLLELGPGGGKEGGLIIYSGPANKICSSEQSIIKNYI